MAMRVVFDKCGRVQSVDLEPKNLGSGSSSASIISGNSVFSSCNVLTYKLRVEWNLDFLFLCDIETI